MYKIQYKKKAIKALAKINEPYFNSLIQAITELSTNPRPYGYIKLTGRNGFRIRVGPYRVIYDILDKFLIIEIVNIGMRSGIYEE